MEGLDLKEGVTLCETVGHAEKEDKAPGWGDSVEYALLFR
jgi:hypothetical protein